jgi:hypothetical protein
VHPSGAVTLGSNVTDGSAPIIAVSDGFVACAWQIKSAEDDGITALRFEGFQESGPLATLGWYELHFTQTEIRVCNTRATFTWNQLRTEKELWYGSLSSFGVGLGTPRIRFQGSGIVISGKISTDITIHLDDSKYAIYPLENAPNNMDIFRFESSDTVFDLRVGSMLELAFGSKVSQGGVFTVTFDGLAFSVPLVAEKSFTLRTPYSPPMFLPAVSSSYDPAYAPFARYLAISAYLIASRWHRFPKGYDLVGAEVTKCRCRRTSVNISPSGAVSNVPYEVTLVLRFYKDHTLLTDTLRVWFDVPPPQVISSSAGQNPVTSSGWFGKQLALQSLPVSVDYAAQIQNNIRISAFE